MFNNIIYLIVVLLIFNMNFPKTGIQDTFVQDFLMHILGWLVFVSYCRLVFKRLERVIALNPVTNDGAARYQAAVTRLSVLAVLLFTANVYIFNLKYWLEYIPGAKTFSVLPGALAIALFFIYLATIWYYSHPAYKGVYGSAENKKVYIISNLRLHLPIIFPWLSLILIYDLLCILPWINTERLMENTAGSIIFFGIFLFILMIFLPKMIQHWWGCAPLGRTRDVEELENFLHQKGLKYRGLLSWPLFEGRMITAGIMGIIPRYRYILLTEGLMRLLSLEELKAVLAHEMGHAKYKHQVFLTLFILALAALSYGLFEVIVLLVASLPPFIGNLGKESAELNSYLYMSISIPMIIIMILYFRYLMGFFMRHFERQADLFAAKTMGSVTNVINSLEKIAFVSGKIRDLPSWHHFSIRERVDCLKRAARDPGVFQRHNRFLVFAFAVYVAGMLGIGWFVNFSDLKDSMAYTLLEKQLRKEIQDKPQTADLYVRLAEAYIHIGKHEKALEAYEKGLSIDPDNAVILNNLAWLLLTAQDESFQDYERGLSLAEEAVGLERSAVFLDTLAEAYYLHGRFDRALELIREALSQDPENRDYFLSQQEKFRRALEQRTTTSR